MKALKVLIAYATMSGSTREIAEFVAAELGKQGLSVTSLPCRAAPDLAEYSAVVLGAPLYMFHLHNDAVTFLKRNRRSLASLPIAVFAGGPYGPNAEADSPGIRKNLDGELEKFAWLKPVSVQLVGGKFDPARLRFPYNLIPALKQAPASDARNWDDIRAWAQNLPAVFERSGRASVGEGGQS